MQPKVSIIILNWNGKKDTVDCIETIKKINYSNYEIILVDNGSVDGSGDFFKKLYTEIEIIENQNNLGFAAGNNVGIQKAMENGADYVLLLNNDTVVHPDFLIELIRVAESDPKIGFVGPKIYYYDYKGRKDVINFAGGKLNRWKCVAYHVGINQIDTGQYDKVDYVDYVEGSCILVKTRVLKDIGLLNPTYFVYWEDTDWCMKGTKKGYKSLYAPKAKIWHKVSASNVGGTKLYYMTRNRFLLLKQNTNFKNYLSFLLYIIAVDFWIMFIINVLYHKNLKNFLAFIRGAIDGLKINP